jgi:hypothetical protein
MFFILNNLVPAGSYNKAYTSAAMWEGKECKIQSQLGKGSVQLIGGANYTVRGSPLSFSTGWSTPAMLPSEVINTLPLVVQPEISRAAGALTAG